MISLCLALLLLQPLQDPGRSQNESPPKSQETKSELAEATSLALQVTELYKQSKFKEALPLAKRCLDIREKILPVSADAVRNARNNLAEVYLALRKYNDAEKQFELLAKSYEESSPNDIRQVGSLQKLALVKFLTGDHDKAERLYQRGVEITGQTFPGDHPQTAAAMSHLAEYYQARGDYKKAEPLYERIFAINEKRAPKGDTEDFRQARDRYACVLYKSGDDQKARDIQSRPLLPEPGSPPAVGSVINGKAISLPPPAYPDEARQARVSGRVVVQVVIDERGRVIRACAIEGPPLLRRAAELAAYGAVFSPTKLSGKPVKVSGSINYNFVSR